MLLFYATNKHIPRMGNPLLEVGRFGLYVFAPIGVFYYIGLPHFRKEFVIPLRDKIYPPDQPRIDIPRTAEEVREFQAKKRAAAAAAAEAESSSE
eukprot:m.45015 g.45015  ORF g.45015 m.45015 type:complete len:95 (-) comp10859_c1_seq1:1211-1495(-)